MAHLAHSIRIFPAVHVLLSVLAMNELINWFTSLEPHSGQTTGSSSCSLNDKTNVKTFLHFWHSYS